MRLIQKNITLICTLAALLLVVVNCSGRLVHIKDFNYVPDGWDMFRNSPDGSAFDTPFSNVNTLLWSRKISTRAYGTPVVNNGLGVIPGVDRRILLFDPENGKGIGKIKIKSSSSSTPAICENLLYVASEKGDGRLRCINLTNGRLVWERQLGDVSAPLILDEGSLLVGNYKGEFYSINRFTGEIEWSYSTDGAIKGGAAVFGGKVLFGSSDGKLYCFDYSTGDSLWSFDSGVAILSSPAVDSVAAYVASFDGILHAIALESGKELWRFRTLANLLSSPVIDRSAVYFGANDGGFYALSKDSGLLIWSFRTETIITTTPLVGSDAVLFADGDGTVYLLDKFAGGKLFEYNTGYSIRSSPVFYRGKIYVVTTGKKIFCFSSQPVPVSANFAE